jgi:hypothetical protein
MTFKNRKNVEKILTANVGSYNSFFYNIATALLGGGGGIGNINCDFNSRIRKIGTFREFLVKIHDGGFVRKRFVSKQACIFPGISSKHSHSDRLEALISLLRVEDRLRGFLGSGF